MSIETLKVSSGDAEVIFDCRDCGACCRTGSLIQLNDTEVKVLELAGTVIEPIAERQGMYEFIGECGYLSVANNGQNTCSIYDDLARPDSCSEFQSGTEVCVYLRAGQGLA